MFLVEKMIDAKDKAIIEALKENARDSIRDISKKTGIRPSTVHQRMQKLIKDNIIEQFTIKTNDKKMGEQFVVFMLINTQKDINKKFLNNKHLKEVFGVTGEYDLLLKFKFSDVEEFNDFVISIREQQEITKTLTMVSTIKIKESV